MDNNTKKQKQADPIDVKELMDELNNLKMAHADLENKYNDLESEYTAYKFDIEFKEDLKSIKAQIPDKDIDILKKLKASNNDEAYKLLLDRYTVQSHTYLKADDEGRFSPANYTPGNGNKVQVGNNSDLFTSAINEVKGGH